MLEPTNNAAEQALRSLVLKRKISGPTLWDFMHKAVHAFIAKTAPPSLMPRPIPAVAPTG